MYKITNLNSFREKVNHKQEIRQAIVDDKTIFCYMLQNENTFDDEASKECRGIVFDNTTGKVIARPLHKFFGVGEKAELSFDKIDFNTIKRVMEKRDGSLIHTVKTNNGFVLKSKKSLSSDVAIYANELISKDCDLSTFVDHMVRENYTLIFELTAPDNRIVVKYDKPSLTLLHIRENDSGEYFTEQEISELLQEYDLCHILVKNYNNLFIDKNGFNLDKLKHMVETCEGVEGWVLQDYNGEMYKVKTKWYTDRHLLLTSTREMDIVEAVLNETIDELKTKLVNESVDQVVLQRIFDIENKVFKMLMEIVNDVESTYNSLKHLSKKEYAISLKQHKYFSLLMKKYDGKDVDYNAYFISNIMKNHFTYKIVTTFGESL